MQATGLALVASGAAVIAGLALLAAGSQVILEGVSQGGGQVGLSRSLEVTGALEEGRGVYAVQITGYRDGTFSAELLGPSGAEIASGTLGSETVEEEFEVREAGNHTLTVRSNSAEQAHVFAAVGPLPDAGKKSLGFVSLYVLVAGMLGLVVSAVYGARRRRGQFR